MAQQLSEDAKAEVLSVLKTIAAKMHAISLDAGCRWAKGDDNAHATSEAAAYMHDRLAEIVEDVKRGASWCSKYTPPPEGNGS